ncbi:MAG: hypothetical protein JWO52_508, partial [Gammaproteobacteria bacterium]|nr:hypothetical protein [Gammaproteobacteria bacterium]
MQRRGRAGSDGSLAQPGGLFVTRS